MFNSSCSYSWIVLGVTEQCNSDGTCWRYMDDIIPSNGCQAKSVMGIRKSIFMIMRLHSETVAFSYYLYYCILKYDISEYDGWSHPTWEDLAIGQDHTRIHPRYRCQRLYLSYWLLIKVGWAETTRITLTNRILFIPGLWVKLNGVRYIRVANDIIVVGVLNDAGYPTLSLY